MVMNIDLFDGISISADKEEERQQWKETIALHMETTKVSYCFIDFSLMLFISNIHSYCSSFGSIAKKVTFQTLTSMDFIEKRMHFLSTVMFGRV